jgi:ADP-heptose:LPS heptosyltransferase
MRSSNLQRALDRGVGRALIGALAAFRRRRPLPAEAGHVVVLQPTAIGDTLVTAGVLTAIRRRFPAARLTVLHGPSNAAALPLVPERFEAIQVGFTAPWRVIGALRRLGPDVVVDLTPWPRSTALCAQLSGAVTVGYDSAGQGRGRAFDIPVPHRLRHELENARAMAAVFDPAGPYRSEVRRPLPEPPAGLAYDRLVLFHPLGGGSHREARNWPPERWAELGARLHREGFQIAITGSEADRPHVEALRARMQPGAGEVLSLAGRLTLAEFAAVIARARCVVSVDTGTVHLASALAAPVVGLYGPAPSSRWGPWGPGGVGVDSPHPAAGYSAFGFEDHPEAGAVMGALEVDPVHAAVRQVLGRTEAARSWA